MIRRKDFMESIGTPDEGFNAAMDRALLQISREERRPLVKRKMRLSLVAAIIVAIALSGVALAIGICLSNRYHTVTMLSNKDMRCGKCAEGIILLLTIYQTNCVRSSQKSIVSTMTRHFP